MCSISGLLLLSLMLEDDSIWLSPDTGRLFENRYTWNTCLMERGKVSSGMESSSKVKYARGFKLAPGSGLTDFWLRQYQVLFVRILSKQGPYWLIHCSCRPSKERICICTVISNAKL